MKTTNFLILPCESCLFLLKAVLEVEPFSISFLEVTIPDVLGNEGGGGGPGGMAFLGSLWEGASDTPADGADELDLGSVDFLPIALKTVDAIEFSLRPKTYEFFTLVFESYWKIL